MANNPVNFADPDGHCSKVSYKSKVVSNDECEESPPLLIFASDGNRTWMQKEMDVLTSGAPDVANALAGAISSVTQQVANMEGDPYPEMISPKMAFGRSYDGPVSVVMTCPHTLIHYLC